MRERITIHSLFEPKQFPFTLTASPEPMPIASGRDYKRRLQGTVGNQSVSLIERFPKEDPDAIINNWIMLRNAGLAVLPTMWKTENNSLIALDVKSDGSEVYGKYFSRLITNPNSYNNRPRPRPEIDRLLGEIDLAQVKEEADRYITLAVQNNVVLPYDDPFELVVHPDGTWNLVILDVEKAKKGTDLLQGTPAQFNRAYVNDFLNDLEKCVNYSLSLPK